MNNGLQDVQYFLIMYRITLASKDFLLQIHLYFTILSQDLPSCPSFPEEVWVI